MERLAPGRLRSLLDAAVSLSSERETDLVLERIVDVARNVVGARYAALAVWRDSHIEDFITSGMTAREVLLIGDLPEGHGLLGAVPAEGAVIRLPDLTHDPRSIGFPPNHPPMRSFLGVPVEYKGEILGHLYLTEKRGAAEFTDEDEFLATGLAALAATAMKNASWAEAEQRRITELEELDRLRRDFIAIASHELAQPASTIAGFLEVLEDNWDQFDEAGRRDLLSRARRQGKELIARLETALDLSRAEEGQLAIDRDDIDLADVAASAFELLPPEDQSRVKASLEPAPCKGDQRRLVRVLHNLVTNALQYSPVDTHVRLEVRPADEGGEMIVTDRGMGIASRELPRIFERYFRGQGDAPSKAPGAGLGLYLSRQIVEAHGGTISVQSEGLGQGAVFRVWLPAQ